MTEKTRIQFELPESAMLRLEKLKEQTEASTNVEVFKNALRIYEEIINQQANGNNLVFVDRNSGKETIFKVL